MPECKEVRDCPQLVLVQVVIFMPLFLSGWGCMCLMLLVFACVCFFFLSDCFSLFPSLAVAAAG